MLSVKKNKNFKVQISQVEACFIIINFFFYNFYFLFSTHGSMNYFFSIFLRKLFFLFYRHILIMVDKKRRRRRRARVYKSNYRLLICQTSCINKRKYTHKLVVRIDNEKEKEFNYCEKHFMTRRKSFNYPINRRKIKLKFWKKILITKPWKMLLHPLKFSSQFSNFSKCQTQLRALHLMTHNWCNNK